MLFPLSRRRRSSPRDGSATVEFAIALPLVLLLSVSAMQMLYFEYLQARLQYALFRGARFASLMEGTNRATATAQIISNELWSTGVSTFEFCPFSSLTPAGHCPTGGTNDPGQFNEYVQFKAQTSGRLLIWPTTFAIKAQRMVKNEPF